jgi:hypothetical protein
MATLFEINALGQDGELRQRVTAALVRKAAFVLDEDAPSLGRRQLAQQAMLSPESLVAPFARRCAVSVTVQAATVFVDKRDVNGRLVQVVTDTSAVMDADIIAAVDVLWDGMAGISKADVIATSTAGKEPPDPVAVLKADAPGDPVPAVPVVP